VNERDNTQPQPPSDCSDTEAQLVKLAIAGDPEAFACLYDTYVDQIFRFILVRVSHRPTAEDLTSLVFLKAWEKLGRYRRRNLMFRGWLFQVARNTVIDHYRVQKETQPLETVANTATDPDADVSQQVEQRLRGEQLWTMMQELTDEQREVLVLKFGEGLSTGEVAEIMGKRQGAVRALQMRALQALETIVKSHE
jgi:RNA polymerase sigma-70 factor, ECF subfamily